MRTHRTRLVASLMALYALGMVFSNALGTDPTPHGGRPRNVAVSDDGHTILVTSMASKDVTILTHNGTGPSSHFVTGIPAKTWGVCFVDANHAIVTHPETTTITVLSRSGSSQSFVKTGSITVPVGCTEVLRSTVAGHAFVANRGRPASGAESWQHSVLEVDVNSLSVVGTPFITEREPRALALSPDGTRLFVGTAQGALGGATVVGTNVLFGHPAPFDGGSVVAYDVSTRQALQRFPAGSPVRGLAVWNPDITSYPSIGHYRIFFTHLGDGAQSEAPGALPIVGTSSPSVTAGGQAIANVISSVAFDENNQPLSRQDVIFRHDPFLNPTPPTTNAGRVDANLAAVVPEKLALRWRGHGSSTTFQLWVTNSASGTVSRASLNPLDDGAIVTNGSMDLVGSGFPFPVVTGRTSDDTFAIDPVADPTTATTVFAIVASPIHVCVDSALSPADTLRPFTSIPMGVFWSPVTDSLYVADEGDQCLVRLSSTTLGMAITNLLPDGAVNPVGIDERRFFTFGRGFDFREHVAGLVQNLACVSCHVDGHIDGKVRFTVMQSIQLAGNVVASTHRIRPVAVPSVFDVGSTEWIFFDGLRTIRDGNGHDTNEPLKQNPGCDMIYCVDTDFFPNTSAFTDVVSSPISPFAPTDSLSSIQVWGRYFFQRMNCTRCHQGAPPDSFVRSFGAPSQPELRIQKSGPLPRALSSENRFLHDVSQSFVSSQEASGGNFNNNQGDNVSYRNMVDVGTRTEGANQIIFRGVNTPALAGAWDNAPYMHDGRYRTLEEVLDDTWVDTGGLAAPIYMVPAGTISDPPDNAFNSSAFVIAGAGTPAPPAGQGVPLYAFGTHADVAPAGRQSVTSFLNSSGSGLPSPPTGTRLAALLDFLRAVSSQTSLSSVLAATGFTAQNDSACTHTTVSWQTPIPITSEVRWGPAGGSLPNTFTTPEGTSHSQVLSVSPNQSYQMQITLNSGKYPSANMPVSRRIDVTPTSWTTCQPGGGFALPTVFHVDRNPSRLPLHMWFTLSKPGAVSIRVYDIAGRRIREVHTGWAAAGTHALDWDGRTDRGSRVSAGTYFLVMKAPDRTLQRRVTLVP